MPRGGSIRAGAARPRRSRAGAGGPVRLKLKRIGLRVCREREGVGESSTPHPGPLAPRGLRTATGFAIRRPATVDS